jgi:hypothetical protein
MYKALNLNDKSCYDVFVVKMLIYYIFLSHSKVLELYIHIYVRIYIYICIDDIC